MGMGCFTAAVFVRCPAAQTPPPHPTLPHRKRWGRGLGEGQRLSASQRMIRRKSAVQRSRNSTSASSTIPTQTLEGEGFKAGAVFQTGVIQWQAGTGLFPPILSLPGSRRIDREGPAQPANPLIRVKARITIR